MAAKNDAFTRSRATISAFILGITALAVAFALASVCEPAKPKLGVYRGDAPKGPANVDAFSRWLGRPVEPEPLPTA